MSVKQHSDLNLREVGKRFLTSLKAPNRYSEEYLDSLETTVAMAALYAEKQGWPDVQEITTEYIEDYLSYLRTGSGGSVSGPTPNPGSCPRGTLTPSTAA